MFHHIAWAMKTQTPDALSKWLLVILADHADNTGMCFPSQTTLANRTGMGRSTINRKLILLEKAELIKRVSGHDGKSTRYYLCVSEGDIPVPERDTPVPERDTKLPVTYNQIEEWEPSDKLTQQINSINGDINHGLEKDKFKDYVLASGKRYVNIDAAYRNWCRNVKQWSTTTSTSKTSGQGKHFVQNNKQSRELLRAVSGLGYSNE